MKLLNKSNNEGFLNRLTSGFSLGDASVSDEVSIGPSPGVTAWSDVFLAS